MIDQAIKDIMSHKDHKLEIEKYNIPCERVTLECKDCKVILYECPPLSS